MTIKLDPAAVGVDLIGVPLELGADCAGIGKGPDAVRNAGLADRLSRSGYSVRDRGDLLVPASSSGEKQPARCKHLPAITQVNEALCRTVSETLAAGRFPLVVGGDHSIALGSMAGASGRFPACRDLGVIWVDAHGDVNTARTTPSGHIHGMPLAASMGFGHRRLTSIGGFRPKLLPQHAVLIGTRSLDPGERRFIRKHGIRAFSVEEIRRVGSARVIDEAMRIAGAGTKGIHLSFDLDVLDPAVAPGVSTPVPGGMRPEEAGELLARIRRQGRIVSAEFVELNPERDRDGATARLAAELIEAFFAG